MEAKAEVAHYRSWLSAELLKRIQTNPAYSLRRFAQHLGLSASTLSGVLSGKRPLTLKSAHHIVDRLGLPPSEAKRFFELVAASHIKGETESSAQVQESRRLSEEAFHIISEWYHFAILELTCVSGCKSDPRWFAKKLGISHLEASAGLKRLLEMGLLEMKHGRLVKTNAHVASPYGAPSAASRRRHKQILEKAVSSLEQHDRSERDMTSITMAINTALLPEAKVRIARFRQELSEFLEAGPRDRVYELSIQLFPLSTNERRSEE